MSGIVFVYVTTASGAEAKKIARRVVAERLAACANILTGMTSVYRWKGKMNSARECVLILKTRKGLYKKLERRVKELHSYDFPCIAALPVVAGLAPYLEWINNEIKKG